LSLIHGRGATLGPRLVESPMTAGVSFTGSTAVGRTIAQRAVASGTRVQCEMGGRNATVVMADSDLTAAVDAVLSSGFGTSGQRCTSSSRVIVERPALEEFTERLVERTSQLIVGPGLDDRTDVGPVVSAPQLDEILSALERAIDEGEEILFGGHRLTEGELSYGHYMEPTITRGTADSWFAGHEVFGPVVSLFEAADYDDAVRINNAVEYGLSSAIYTRSLECAMRFIRQTDTGMVHVNRPTVGAEPHIPFGGAKASSIGPPELGDAWQFYTKSRSAHVRWSG
jgi:acyl-CoA reductase-like NAD-dependent aldehyde dehydrogenase